MRRPRPRTVRRRVAMAGLALLGVGVVAFGVAAPPERCPTVSAAELRAAATEATDWFARNQEPDGTWLYLYDADADVAPDEYNVVRHAGGIMGLYQAAAAGIPGALEAADRGLAWAEDRLVERDDWAALSDQGRTATGATALLVAGLVERREATGDDRHDALLAELGRFLAAQTEPSGAVLANYDLRVRRPRAGGVLGVLHRRDLLGLHPAPPARPRRGLGRAGRSGGGLPGHATRRRRGPLAADPRPLGGLRAGRDRGVRRPARRRTADRRRGGVRRRAGRVLRRPGAVGRAAPRALGRAGPDAAAAAGRRVRGGRRGAHRAVAGGRGRASAGGPARTAGRPRHLHRGPGRRPAGGRGRGGGLPGSGPGSRRLVPRRRDPHGRPAARTVGAAPHRRHRRGGRERRGRRPRRGRHAPPRRRSCGPSRWSPPSTRSGPPSGCPAPGAGRPSASPRWVGCSGPPSWSRWRWPATRCWTRST